MTSVFTFLSNNQWKQTPTRPCFISVAVMVVVGKGVDDVSKFYFVKRDSFAPGSMAWVGVSFHGKTDIKVKKSIHTSISIKFSSLLCNKDLTRMIHGDQIKDMVFHQDSASSRTSKHTLAYMRQQKNHHCNA